MRLERIHPPTGSPREPDGNGSGDPSWMLLAGFALLCAAGDVPLLSSYRPLPITAAAGSLTRPPALPYEAFATST